VLQKDKAKFCGASKKIMSKQSTKFRVMENEKSRGREGERQERG
jgi:hypothetical protein